MSTETTELGRRMAESAHPETGLPDGAKRRGQHGVHSPADDCVHCGFCLPACPTYHNWAEEMDSPRGRIDLFKALEDGRVTMSRTVATHFDRCLGCMACVSACPSGVRYDHIIDKARARVEAEYRRPLGDALHRKLVFQLFPRPGRLQAAAVALWFMRKTGVYWLVRKLRLLRFSRRLEQMNDLAPSLPLRKVFARLPAQVPARGPKRLRVALMTGCVQRVFFPDVNAATLRVLAAEGVEVVVPQGQGCCGALSAHGGRDDEARRLARALVERLEREEFDYVVVNAAGCGSHLKDLGHFFREDPAFAERAARFAPRVRDVLELLHGLPAQAPRAPIRARVAYHNPCHLGHAQKIGAEPRALLRSIPGLELVEVPDGEQCCGSAGIYNLVQPESADQVGRRKADAVLSTGATLLASANPGCTLHIQRMLAERGVKMETAHPIELLDRAIQGAKP